MIDKNKFNWRKYLKECLEATVYCSLGTVDRKGVWSNPVYFAYDDSYNLYFISMPHSRHMKNIKMDGRIAVSIYSTNQDTHGDVVGIQLEGEAYVLPDKEVPDAHKLYFKRVYPNGHDKNPKDNMGKKAV